MAIPVWFDSNAYLVNKAAQMNMGSDVLEVLGAFKAAGWPTDAEGLYDHFVQYGNNEGVAPNSWFNADQYMYGKAVSFYGTGSVSVQQLSSLKAIFTEQGYTAWDHYQDFWSEDYSATTGKGFYNPSAMMNVDAYMDAKLALMKAGDATYTMDKLVKAFNDAGVDPYTHYMLYGKAEGLKIVPAEGGVPGATINLTGNNDTIQGTTGSDYIKSNPNTLNDGDYIDGQGGDDMLYATLNAGNGGFGVVSPEIRNVENILFRAQTSNTSGTGDNLTKAYFDAENVTFDNPAAELTIGSDNSRANMSIEDIRWNSNQTTIRFADADPGDVDLHVYFDPQHMTSEEGTSTGTMVAKVIDAIGAMTPAQSTSGHSNGLWDLAYDKFTIKVNGTDYTLNFGKYNHTTDETPTYAELAKQIQAAIDKHPELAKMGITVTTGGSFNAVVGIGPDIGKPVTGTELVFTINNGEMEGVNWDTTGGMPSTASQSATFSDTTENSCPLLQTSVELDNVGRVVWADASPECLPDDIINGSKAGDLVIGSMASRGGIERMDITVEDGSWLSSISSTNQALRMITVEGGTGQLYIGDFNGKTTGTANNLVTWSDAARLLTAGGAGTDDEAGLNDVAVFDATGYKGDINIGANITAASFDKYFKSVNGDRYIDEMYAPLADAAYKGAFSYFTGEGNDTINMSVNGAIAANVDFKMNIATGKGDDLVAFRYDAMTSNQSDNQKNLNNVTIDTGEGDDTVWFYAPDATTGFGGSVIIKAGAGNDTIYANQQDFGKISGTTPPTAYNAVFAFNTNDTRIGVAGITGATLQNDTAVGKETFTITTPAAGDILQVTVTFKGHSATVSLGNVAAADTQTLTAEQVNHAIINAITNDPVLSQLLVAKDGSAHTLLIESLINGEMSLADLGIEFGSIKADGTAGTSDLDTGNWYNTKYATGAGDNLNAPYKGNDTTNSQVNVDGGTGDDVIVLGSNDNLMDIVTVGEGAGNDTIVDFQSGIDKLNLGGILDKGKTVVNAGATALVNNAGTILAGNAAAATGIFTQAEVSKMVTDKLLSFANTDKGTAVVLLQDVDADGNNVYTLVKMVNGATPTATVLGSITLDATDGIANALAFADFTTSDVLLNAGTHIGTTYDAYSGLDLTSSTPGSTLTLTAGIYDDTFNNVNDLAMTSGDAASPALFTTIDANFGNDVFNVNGTLGNTKKLRGDGGIDTFNFGGTPTFAVAAEINGGSEGDIFNINNETGKLVTINTALNGDAGNDVFNFNAKATDALAFAAGAVRTINGDDDYDIVNFKYDLGAHTEAVGTSAASYTVSKLDNIEEMNVYANNKVILSAAMNNDGMNQTVTINVDAKSQLTMQSLATGDASVVYDIHGGNLDDTLFGGDGNDTIVTGNGKNSVTGGDGNDTITLGTGMDTVFFSAGKENGTDSITGFEVGTGKDVLNVGQLGVAATIIPVTTANAQQTLANDGLYVYNDSTTDPAIAGKDFSAANFAELFGTGKVFAAANAAANAESVIVVQGSDETQIYAIKNNGDTTITADEVFFVGVLEDVTSANGFHADNFSAAI